MNNTYSRIAYWVITALRKSNQGSIYIEALNSLGEDVSPIYNDLGCVESWATDIYRSNPKRFKEVKGMVSTTVAYKYLKKSKKFIEVLAPEAGDTIISPSGYGTGGLKHGHIGIVGVKGIVMSNNSKNSLLEENYTISSWKARYFGIGGFPVKYFRAV